MNKIQMDIFINQKRSIQSASPSPTLKRALLNGQVCLALRELVSKALMRLHNQHQILVVTNQASVASYITPPC